MSEGMNQSWICPNCGTAGNTGNFCATCGYAKPVAPVQPAPAPAPATAQASAPAPAPAPVYTPVQAPAAAPYQAPVAAPVQPPYQQTYQPPVQAKGKPEFTRQDKKKANIMCIISLCLTFGMSILFSLIIWILGTTGMGEESILELTSIGIMILLPAYIAGIVLMIIVRVRFRRSVFGKVLMFIYIALAVISLISVVFLVGACIESCQNASC